MKSTKKNKIEKTENPRHKAKRILHILRPAFWFFVGVFFASLCIVTFMLIYFKTAYKGRIIPGVFIGEMYVGEKKPQDVETTFKEKNKKIGRATFTFVSPDQTATISAEALNIGYDEKLIALQAASIGNSKDIVSNTYYIINSYLNGTYLSPSYTTGVEKINAFLAPMQKTIYKEPVDALFNVANNRVVAFKQSENGKTIDYALLTKMVEDKIPSIISGDSTNVVISVPIKTVKPNITTENANNLGIVEVIGVGNSAFGHSIPNRIHNVALAASKINGVIVAPNEIFSFDKNLGDVSKFTGYKEAYVIENGKTVLGDGGGVCQVSTTLFRAALDAGLPITERTAHAYRVGYYEEDSPPGIDATVFYPTVDLKFKNDTGHYLFIQEAIDLNNLTLSFTIYGKSDGRKVSMTTPVVTSIIPAPEAQYQDDPSLPKGVEKQIDFAAAGATVSFNRTVTRNGKVILSDTYKSVYRPWRAVFLRGTKEG